MDDILLIDDNLVYNSNFIKKLESKYTVDAVAYVNTAKHKLEHAPKGYYKLIVMDIMMPTLGLYTEAETNDGLLTGIVFYKKEIMNKYDIPVLFWTMGRGFKTDVKEILGSKVIYMEKNLEEDHLLKEVNEILKIN